MVSSTTPQIGSELVGQTQTLQPVGSAAGPAVSAGGSNVVVTTHTPHTYHASQVCSPMNMNERHLSNECAGGIKGLPPSSDRVIGTCVPCNARPAFTHYSPDRNIVFPFGS